MKIKRIAADKYTFLVLLVGAVVFGACLGWFLKEKAVFLKPFGDIFLNLLFTCVVPLVFFSISSAVASMEDLKRLGKILFWMIIVFILTGIIASFVMLAAVKFYAPAQGVNFQLETITAVESSTAGERIVKAFTVSDFGDLFSKKNMLALIIFSLLIGLSVSLARERAGAFKQFLASGNAVMGKVIDLVMLYAPVGLGAYFAYLVGVFGPQLMGSYVRAMILYYPVAILYFLIFFSAYVYWASGFKGLKKFWPNILPSSLTALATGSSLATVPSNLESAKRIGIPEDIREVVIPMGATIHMEGSCLSAILKISFLFGIFQLDFSGVGTLAIAVGIALLSGTVMSGIPGGGFLGEILIVTLYGFPPEALPLISMIGTLVDPPATMVNATGDSVAGMMLARILGGKHWMKDQEKG